MAAPRGMFIKDLGIVNRQIDLKVANLRNAAHAVMDRDTIEAANYAKTHAPWTDRTGDARRSIDTIDLSDRNTIRFYLFIGVWYGQFLELANDGKYRILRPTATIYEQKILEDLKNLGAI